MTATPIALTFGEPAGIGPEITVKAWRDIGADVPFVLLGDYKYMAKTADIPVRKIVSAADWSPDALCVLDTPFAPITAGEANPANAAHVINVIRHAVHLTQTGDCSAVVTNPINKKALKDGAGFAFPGHTEFLADLTRSALPVMMLASPALRVVPVTIHIPLAEVPTQLTPELLEQTIRITAHDLEHHFGIIRPRIAVAGLNPHAGEGGAMGTEDITLIQPVIAALKSDGFDIFGPLPADTMFHERARETYDVAICMYHDQALIPIKTLDFDRGVNVTLGLPIIRTSPDHGTAYDIAGKGVANPSSLIAALRLAHDMAQQ